MKKVLLILIFLSINSNALGSVKENIINNLKIINNLSFDFEQNINGKIETGNCILEYPKKNPHNKLMLQGLIYFNWLLCSVIV